MRIIVIKCFSLHLPAIKPWLEVTKSFYMPNPQFAINFVCAWRLLIQTEITTLCAPTQQSDFFLLFLFIPTNGASRHRCTAADYRAPLTRAHAFLSSSLWIGCNQSLIQSETDVEVTDRSLRASYEARAEGLPRDGILRAAGTRWSICSTRVQVTALCKDLNVNEWNHPLHWLFVDFIHRFKQLAALSLSWDSQQLIGRLT